MQILQRVGYYMGGFSVGLVLLAFFIKGSDTEIPSCDYMPNARVLKTIRNKGYVIDNQFNTLLDRAKIDTIRLNRLFTEGDVIFDKSDSRKKPCGIFYIESSSSAQDKLHAVVSICEDKDKVTVTEIGKD